MKVIPHRKRIPLITDLLEFKIMTSNPINFSSNMVNKYGDVCHVPLPGVNNYFVHDPEVVKGILVTHASKFQKSRIYRALKMFLGEGLITTNDQSVHKQQRRLVAPAFHKQRIHEYSKAMVNCTLQEIANWKHEETINVTQAMANITIQVITQTMFGSHIGSETSDKISKKISELLHYSGRIFKNPAYFLFFEKDMRIPIIKKFYQIKDEVDKIIGDIIKLDRKKSNSDGNDFLSMLMNARDEDTGATMSDEQLRDEIMTMFVAGHETTSASLSWAWYLLGKNPEIDQLFYQEVKEKIGDKLPNADDYQLLSKTRNIFKETMRLYPPAWTIAREATEDVEIEGYHFPKGSVTVTLIYLMHRKECFYDKPDAFIPERWNAEKLKDLPKYAYFPFGGGNRMCIGEGFAWMEAVMILATIRSKFHLKLSPQFDTTVDPRFTLRTKDDIYMQANRL